MSKYDDFLSARRARIEAENWNNLPRGPKYQNDKFAISPAHCKLTLVRAGQQSCGSKNYWDSPSGLSSAILQILSSDNSIIIRAIESMKEAERLALIACEDEARERLAAIELAKKG